MFRKNTPSITYILDKKSLMEGLDLVLMAVDEICDQVRGFFTNFFSYFTKFFEIYFKGNLEGFLN